LCEILVFESKIKTFCLFLAIFVKLVVIKIVIFEGEKMKCFFA